MTEDAKIEPKKDDKPDKTIVEDPPKEDPLLELLVGMKDDNQKIIVDTINSQQTTINELKKALEEIQQSSVSDKKQAILDNLKDSGLDVKEFGKYTLEQLQAIANALSQNNDKIVIKTKKDESTKPDFEVTVWDPETQKPVPFYKTESK